MPQTYQPGAPGHVLITGASSGIGTALALLYAAPGVRLSLQGRDGMRLGQVAAACQAVGAKVTTAALDIRDRPSCAAWVEVADAAAPVDLVVANAGISGTGADAVATTETNVNGTFNTVEPLLPRLTARSRGQVALMSSLASFRGTAQAPAYCASKAAVRLWGEGLRGRLLQQGVVVSVICPGFIATPMTARNPFPMPLLMTAERAAAIIARSLAQGRARIAFPWRLYALARLYATLPQDLGDRLLAGYRSKE
jgi:short-subunit dehydrogenase